MSQRKVEVVCRFCGCRSHEVTGEADQIFPEWVVAMEQPTLPPAFQVCPCPCHFRAAHNEEAYKEAFYAIFGNRPVAVVHGGHR